MQTEMSSSPPTGKGASYWRFMFACWLTIVYFNVFTNNVNKKMTKKALFFGHPACRGVANAKPGHCQTAGRPYYSIRS
jgi:hypothetical protein